MHTPFEADAEGFELLHSDNESDTGEVQERPHGFPRTLSSDWTHASGFDASDVLKAFTSGAQCGDSSSAVQSRNAFFVWTFVSYFCWGILTELYSDLFVEVIDKNNYGSAAFYSTVAMSTYSITGFLWSPVMATLSDTIGRKAVFIISACLNAVSGIFMGLVPSNWVFISMAALQGLGGKNAAVGYALLADYNAAVPLGWTGSKDDDIFHQWLFWIIRLGAAGPQLSTQGKNGFFFVLPRFFSCSKLCVQNF
jgi:MFS family permease